MCIRDRDTIGLCPLCYRGRNPCIGDSETVWTPDPCYSSAIIEMQLLNCNIRSSIKLYTTIPMAFSVMLNCQGLPLINFRGDLRPIAFVFYHSPNRQIPFIRSILCFIVISPERQPLDFQENSWPSQNMNWRQTSILYQITATYRRCYVTQQSRPSVVRLLELSLIHIYHCYLPASQI